MFYIHYCDFAKGVKQGINIKKGELIGYVGNTGLSSGPHLHLGLYKNGTAIDPLTVINKPSTDGLDGKERNAFLATAQTTQKKIENEIKKEKRNIPTKLERITDRSEINIF